MRRVIALAVICLMPAGCFPNGDAEAGKDSKAGAKAYYDRLPKDDDGGPASPQVSPPAPTLPRS